MLNECRVVLAVGTMMVLLAGCDQAQEERAAKAAADAVHKTNEVLREAGASAKAGAREANEALREVGAAAKDGAIDATRALEDGGLTAKVKTALLAEADVKGASVDVDTRAGVVTLTGNLPDAAQVERAIAIARRVDGVKAVESKLRVAG